MSLGHRAKGNILNLDNLNKWSTLITNIAVVAGILFLGYELNQNNENLEAQSRYNYRDGRAEGNLLNAHDPVFAGIMVKSINGEELSQTELFQLDAYFRYMFVNWEWAHGEVVRGRGGLGAESVGAVFATFPQALETWSRARDSYNESFQNFVESEVLPKLESR